MLLLLLFLYAGSVPSTVFLLLIHSVQVLKLRQTEQLPTKTLTDILQRALERLPKAFLAYCTTCFRLQASSLLPCLV